MEEMINEVATETVNEVAAEAVNEAANGSGFLKEAGKYGIAAAVGAGLTIAGQKLFKKAKEKKLAKKAKKAVKEEVSKVDQLCKEIEDSLKD